MIRSRIEALERRANGADGAQVITILGGLDGDPPRHACAGGLRWERGAGESLAAFTQRAQDEAAARGERVLVLGGLPS